MLLKGNMKLLIQTKNMQKKETNLLPFFASYKMLKIANKVGINFALLTQATQSKSIKTIKLYNFVIQF